MLYFKWVALLKVIFLTILFFLISPEKTDKLVYCPIFFTLAGGCVGGLTLSPFIC